MGRAIGAVVSVFAAGYLGLFLRESGPVRFMGTAMMGF